MNMRNIIGIIGLAAVAATPAAALVTVTPEAAGVQSSTRPGATNVVTFDALNHYIENYQASFGDLTATFDRLLPGGANAYGGAYGSNFVTVQDQTTISLSRPISYFGLWASALDGGNSVDLLFNGVSIGLVDLTATPLGAAYYGNPNNGADPGEKFAFFNLASDRQFNGVRLVQNGGGGFELDNATFMQQPVPEPATWAMMLAGMALVGLVLRRRARTLARQG
jgi:hypothetical protein